MAAPTDYAAALRYGPQTTNVMRRSQYLADALKAMSESGGKNIQSGGELATKLLATALLQRSSEKARSATVDAIRADQKGEADRLLAGFSSMGMEPTPQPAPTSGIGAAIGRMADTPTPSPILNATPQAQPQPLPSAAPQSMAAGGIDPALDAIVRTVWGEARNEAKDGQAAVASVILNRAKKTGRSPLEIVREPNQFEPWGNPKTRQELEGLNPASPEYQAILQNIAPALQGQDVTGGADHFYSPTAQQALGRPPPKWDNGSGRDLGRHRFFSLGYGGQGAHRRDIQPPEQFQVAASQLLPGMIPSAPGASSPAPAGMAPAAPPQAAAGATTLQPTQQEMARARSLLADPRTFEAGKAYVMELQERAVTPIKRDTQTINGMPYQIDPYTGVLTPVGVPEAAKTQVLDAQQAGLPSAPQGLYVQRDPLGNLKEAPGAPPEGFNAGPNGYAPIQGGPADPYAAQKPSAGYQYQNGVQTPIQGSAADPRNINNILTGTKQFRDEIKTVVDQALQVKRNIDSVRAGYAQQNGAGDIAIINGLQRMIDDGVVREGDVALQLKAQGVAGSLSGLEGFVRSKGPFADPKIRDALLATANSLYAPVSDNYRNRIMGYRPIADKAYGDGTFDSYVFTPETAQALGWGAAAPPPPAPAAASQQGPAATPGSREAAIAEARRRGLIK